MKSQNHNSKGSLFSQTILILIIFIIGLNLIFWFFYQNLRSRFNEDLGNKLVGIAQSARVIIDGDWVTYFSAGDENTKLYKRYVNNLNGIINAWGVSNIYVFDLNNKILLDATGVKKIGDEVYTAKRDEFELNSVRTGRGMHSILFQGEDKAWYKTGYAPLKNSDNDIVAICAVDMSAQFMTLLIRYRQVILLFDIICLVLTGFIALYLWKLVIIPLRKILIAFEFISKGSDSVSVDITSKNEIGLLGNSFNLMAKELIKNKQELEKLYKTAEIKAEKFKDFNDYVVNSVSTGILTVDLNGAITSINPSAEGLLKLDNSSVKRHYRTVFSDMKKLQEIISDSLSINVPINQEEIHVDKGKNSYLRINPSHLKNKFGSVIGVGILIYDVTEYRLLSDRIKLNERLAAIGEMSAGIAHELRNPLNGINLLLGILKRSVDDQLKRNDTIEKIELAIGSLNSIISDFLTYARPAKPDRKNIDICELLDECSQLALPGLPDNSLVKEYQIESLVVGLDKNQIKQVFLNILINASQVINKEGFINIYIGKTDKNAVVKIRDNGKGISTEDKQKIFDPFFTTREGGTGLGLAIAKKIIDEHEGMLYVDSPIEKARGSEFVIELPLTG